MGGTIEYEKEWNDDLWEKMYPVFKRRYWIYTDTACGWKWYKCTG